VDAKGAAHLSSQEEDHTTESNTPGGGGEPGANPNLSTNGPVSVAGGAGGGATSTEEETKQTYAVVVPTTTIHTTQSPGAAQPVAASVRVPRSYFVRTYKDTHKDAEPDDAALTALITEETSHIVQDVKNCTGIKDDAAISVNWYSDAGAALSGGPNSPSSPVGSPFTTILMSHVREIGVGMLAMVSLAMVMMMVRKSAPVPIPIPDEVADRQKATQRLDADMPVAGEVAEGDKMMDGMELDDEAVKTQQMIEQVSSMVTENPDSAANLVKRWLNRP
jgi:flagellar biosynthesis/type III secretory pathway M-ring protein FliF/YscJ